MVHHLCSSLLISASLSLICPRRHRSLPLRHRFVLIVIDLCLFVTDLSCHRQSLPLCRWSVSDSPPSQTSPTLPLRRQSISDSPIYDYLSLTPICLRFADLWLSLSHTLGSNLGIFWWVCYLVLGGGFVIWFWMGMVCGGPVVVGICLMVFCGGPVVVDGGWIWVLCFGFGFGFVIWFWVCFCLWLGWLGVEVVGSDGCDSGCG